jgi:hypothetical protein
MSKAKTLMVSFLGVSLVFALMVTTIPTLANAETLAPSEPGVSLGKPLSDDSLKDTTARGVEITVYQANISTGNNTQYNYVNISTTTNPYRKTLITTPSEGTITKTKSKTVTVPYWFHK